MGTPFQIRKRSLLVVMMSIATLSCVALGIAVYSGWLESRIRATIQQQVLADNVQTAKQLSRLVEEMHLGSLKDEQSWDRLQTIVEEIELPNDGFVCVVDSSSGKLVCHPKMRDIPELRGVAVGKCLIEIEGEGSKINDAVHASEHRLTGGMALIKGELQIVAVSHLPTVDANVLVHQRESGIDRSIARIMGPVKSIGFGVAALIGVLVLFVNFAIIRKYENRLASINEQLEETVRRRTRSLMKTRNAVIFGLAKLSESRDTDTGQHLERIRIYVTVLAEQMMKSGADIDLAYVEDISLASSLHDIGKVGIPDAVLLKPGRFTTEERTIMERHSQLGGDCLRAIQSKLGDDDFLSLATEIAYFHHEKWDGTGYPSGKAGKAIPLSARIVALADVYDALTSKRPYKEPMPHEKAKSIIIEGMGQHFDPDVVAAFLACEPVFIDISAKAAKKSGAPSAVAQLQEELAKITAVPAAATSDTFSSV